MAQHWIATRPGDLDVFEFQTYDVATPQAGEVTITVRAAGVNPADPKQVANGDPADFPKAVGFEVAGVIAAVGPGTEIASGPVQIGDEVLAFRVNGGWATEVTVPAADVFAKPGPLGFAEAANLLLAATTAAEMLHVTGMDAVGADPSVGDRGAGAVGRTILVHGASGAVGVSVLQQAALLGLRVIGTASPASFDVVRRFGGEPVAYGEDLARLVHELAPDGVAAALDCVGTDEAVDVSLALIPDDQHASRIVTIAALGRAESDGIIAILGSFPASAAYRDSVRAHLIDLAGTGRLVVPMADSYPLADALDAARVLLDRHPGGKLTLLV